MKNTPSILLEIQQKLPELTGNYQVIAKTILAHPEAILRQKVSDCAALCRCDPAQVIRFCKKLGFNGFPDLKNRLTEGLLGETRTLRQQLSGPVSDFEQFKAIFAEQFVRTINDTVSIQTEAGLRQAAEMAANAKHILVCGFGASALMARDLQTKLFRLNYPVSFWDDAECGRQAAAALTAQDMLLAISFSGETFFLLQSIKIARTNHVPVLALTNYPRSTLAKNADCVLLTASDEQKLRVGAMTSIIAQYCVCDLFCTILANRDPDRVGQRIQKLYERMTEQEL